MIGIDYGLVVPDESKTLRGGAVKPWQTRAYKECQDDLEKYAKKRGIPLDTPWRELTRRSSASGSSKAKASWDEASVWYGVALLRVAGDQGLQDAHPRAAVAVPRLHAVPGLQRRAPQARGAAVAHRHAAPCRRRTTSMLHADRPSVHDDFFDGARSCRAPLDEATDLLLDEIRTRLDYLCDVGLGYLTLDRQSRTLSGGEVQRINLTTALGTSLVNTLFVLDEPSIGLHPRDMGRVIEVMKRLRDAGNSLVVVEHDPQIMLAADRILDMGPGPGERGGEIVFFGTPDADSRAARHAHRRLSLGPQARRRRARATRPHRPDAARAMRAIDGSSARRARAQPEEHRRRIPAAAPGVRHRRVGLGQVHAGAGRAATRRCCKHNGKPTETPGAHRRAARRRADRRRGDGRPVADRPDHALQPGELRRRLRRDPRALRRTTPLAQERGYTAGTFSFNSGNGRCPTCGGNGFEHVEMQFLSDVYLRCPDCDGRRYRAEVLEVDAKARRRAPASPTCSTDRHRGAARSSRTTREVARAPAAAGRRGPRVPEARPAGADAVGRRSAAPEARRASRRGRRSRVDSAVASAARCSCSTSRPPACTSTTSPSCCARSASCSQPAIRCS